MNSIVCLNVRTHVTSHMCYPAITLLGQICLNSPLSYLLENHLCQENLQNVYIYAILSIRVHFLIHIHTKLYHLIASLFTLHLLHAILHVKHALVYICLYVCTQIVNLLLNKPTYILTCTYFMTINQYKNDTWLTLQNLCSPRQLNIDGKMTGWA